MEEMAYAKINLALHVRGLEPDGYHRIETLFAFCEDGDSLQVAPGSDLSLEIGGPFAAELSSGADNLVRRAAKALARRCERRAGASLRLDKRLPVAAGLGGGSADAAAALRLLNRWWKVGLPDAGLVDIARGLGADVPACLASRTMRGEGRGDRLAPAPMPELAGSPVLLANPGMALSTAAVFQGWDGRDGGRLEDHRQGRNDLEAAAIMLAPAIGQVLEALRTSEGATLTRMSGSGATCFALFETPVDRDRAYAVISAAHPDWWLLATRLR